MIGDCEGPRLTWIGEDHVAVLYVPFYERGSVDLHLHYVVILSRMLCICVHSQLADQAIRSYSILYRF